MVVFNELAASGRSNEEKRRQAAAKATANLIVAIGDFRQHVLDNEPDWQHREYLNLHFADLDGMTSLLTKELARLAEARTK